MGIVVKKTAVKVEAIMDDGYDPIVTFASRIENVESRTKMEEIVNELIEERERGFWRLGGAIARTQVLFAQSKKPGAVDQFTGYDTFREYIETTLGVRYRKAMYAAEMYKRLIELDLPWSAFQGIGWTKMVRLLPIATKDNVKELIEKAKGMSRPELEAHIKAEKAKAAGTPAEAPAEAKTIVTKSFKLHPDQKQLSDDAIAKAKEEGNTEVDSVAYEYICQSFMGGGLAFSDPKQALTYARKHSDNPSLFAQQWIDTIEELCPELTINAEITIKGEPLDHGEGEQAA